VENLYCSNYLSLFSLLLPVILKMESQTTQSAGPVHFLIFCSISIFLLANLVVDRRPQRNSGAEKQGTYSTIPIHWNIKSAPASPGRSRVGPALYEYSLLSWSYLGGPGGGWPVLPKLPSSF
jgi:hypothetical protein